MVRVNVDAEGGVDGAKLWLSAALLHLPLPPIASYSAPITMSRIRKHRGLISLVTSMTMLALKSRDPNSIAYAVFSTDFFALAMCSHLIDNSTALPQLAWADTFIYWVTILVSTRLLGDLFPVLGLSLYHNHMQCGPVAGWVCCPYLLAYLLSNESCIEYRFMNTYVALTSLR